ncbi:MAG: ABC transporter permease subunit, partial [Fuerstiella sp.]|nr:ABC transporter permease subunit [Fuerstiella sp.]
MSDDTQSRSMQKFLRHRPAIVSLAIIVIYVMIAATLLLSSVVTIEQTLRPVGPFNLPGFGGQKLPEKRLSDIERDLNAINTALRRSDTQEQLRGVRSGSLVLGVTDPQQLRTELDEIQSTIDKLYEYEDLDLMVEDGTGDAPEMLEQLGVAESRTHALFQLPPGQTGPGRQLELLLGTDQQGRSILLRGIWSVRVAILVGFVTGIVSVILGTTLGLLSGYFGGWVDNVITWIYSTFASIPNIVLLIVLSFAFSGGEFDDIVNGWTGGLVGRLVGGPL